MHKGMKASGIESGRNAMPCEIGDVDHDALRADGFYAPNISADAIERLVIARKVQGIAILDLG